MILLELFWSFFQIGLFSFGGGYAAMPLIQAQVVDGHGWLTMREFADLITLSQMTPGPIAINSATFVGTQIAGLPGALAATAGCVLPSCAVALLLARLYRRYKDLWALKGALDGLRSAVAALIALSGVSLLSNALWGGAAFSTAPDSVALGLFVLCLFVLRRWRPDPILVMLGAGVLGGALYLWLG